MCIFRYPNSAVWWYDFRYRGRRYRHSTHTRDRVLAGRIERERRRALEQGLSGLSPAQQPRRLQELYDDLVEKKRTHWTQKTFETARHSWGHLQPLFGKMLAHEVSTSDIARFRDARLADGVSPFSINRNLALLRSLLRRANVWHLLRQDYKPLPVEEQSGTALTEEQEQRLLASVEQSSSLCLRVVVLLALSTGMRYTELRMLRWAQIDFDFGYLIVGHSKSKAGRGRRILLPPRAAAAMRKWASRFPSREPHHFVFCRERYGMKNHLLTETTSYKTDPMHPMGSFNVAWRSARKKAGLELRFHDLRHTVVTRLLEGGTPFNTVALMMGWSPANMVLMIRKYGHLVDKSWRSAVQLLDGKKQSGKIDHSEKQNKTNTAAPAPDAGDSRQEEPEQCDAAAGDPSAEKGGSSEAA